MGGIIFLMDVPVNCPKGIKKILIDIMLIVRSAIRIFEKNYFLKSAIQYLFSLFDLITIN